MEADCSRCTTVTIGIHVCITSERDTHTHITYRYVHDPFAVSLYDTYKFLVAVIVTSSV